MLSDVSSYIVMHKVDIFWAIALTITGLFIAYVLKRALTAIVKKHAKDATVELFVVDVIYLFLLAIVFISVLNKVGVPTNSLLTLLGASGLAVALALKDSLSNVASGIMLVFQKPFRLGDNIEIAGITGFVMEITLFNTKIKTPNNELIYLPNSKIITDKIINKTAKPTRRLVLPFYVSHRAALSETKALIQSVLATEKRILDNPAADIIVESLEVLGVLMHVRVWVKTAEYSSVKNGLLEKLSDAFQAAELALPYFDQTFSLDKLKS